jgi:hydroxymethylglutaryl-CoA lyase
MLPMRINPYPQCAASLALWLQKSPQKIYIYEKLNPRLFDVTLRDGLQTIPKEQINLWPTAEKKTTYHHICSRHQSKNIEIGSLASPKVLPIFADSLNLYKQLEEESLSDVNKYMLIPNLKMLKLAMDHNVKNFSFITSVSNAFQKKNTNTTLDEKKMELKEMVDSVNTEKNKIKLYISCINECPLTGTIDNDWIVNEILNYEKNMKVDELCLSDTCGTLKFDDFEYIIDACLYFGIPPSKLSLHLHFSENSFINTKQIVYHAFEKRINKFDVSMFDMGGCSVTMSANKCNKNLTYDAFYKILVDYIEKKADM